MPEFATEPELDLPITPGQLVAGKYLVDRILGVGGMGPVVLSHHKDLNQRFALKVLLPSSGANKKDAAARFVREARAAARLTSPNVARVVDYGVLPSGAPFLAMEYLEGNDLAIHLKQKGP